MSDRARQAPAVELPDGWAWATLDEVAEINPKVELDGLARDLEVTFVRMAAVEEETGRLNAGDIRRLGDVAKGYTRFREGDVLFSKITPCMENGKIAHAGNLRNGRGFGSTEFHVLRPRDGVEAKYLLHFLLQPSFRKYAEHNMKGTAGQKRVPPDILRESWIPIAPLPEQRRIVEKIEAVLSEIANGVESLDALDRKLATYRHSVLRAGVTGALTQSKRDNSASTAEAGQELLSRISERYKKPKNILDRKSSADLPFSLPRNWAWAALPEIGHFGRGKSMHRPRSDPRLYGGKYPFIQTGEVRSAGGRISNYNNTYNEAGLNQSKLWPKGTICITIAGNIAETGILEFDACFPDSVVGLIPDKDISGQFIEYFIRTIKDELYRFAPATAQKNINLNTLYGVLVPFPPRDEQDAIVELIDEKLTAVESVDSASEWAIQRSNALRRSILNAAFAGRLVPKDPNEEPATDLMARIRAGQAETPKTSAWRGRPRKTSGTSKGATS